MFYSYDHLVGRNGKFALIWRLATAGSKTSKAFSKATILEVSVPETCKALMEMVPTSVGGKGEISSKFSLYLLSQLLYGITIVLERQTIFLEIDARAACTSVEQFFLNIPLQAPKRKSLKGAGEEHERRPKRAKHHEKGDHFEIGELPPVDLTTMDGIGTALYNQITLNDEIPRAMEIPLGEDLPPHTREELEDWNREWDVAQSRHSSNNSQEKVRRLTEFGEEIAPVPGKEQAQMEKYPPLEPLPMQDITPMGDFSMPPFGDFTAPLPPRQRTPTPLDESRRADLYDIIPLDPAVPIPPTPTSVKRRRPALTIRDDVSLIPMKTMSENVADFSSTLRSRQEILIREVTGDNEVQNMLKPYPTWGRRPFNKELMTLYKTKHVTKMTYEQAAKIDINAPLDRGPASQLWRYEGSSEEFSSRQDFLLQPLDEELRPIGIGFIHEATPEHIKEQHEMMDIDGSGMPPLPPMPDIDELEPLMQKTQQSELEEQRRSIGHLTAESARHSEVLERSMRPSGIGIGLLHDTDEDSKLEQAKLAQYKKDIKHKMLQAVYGDGGGLVSISSLVPHQTCTRGQAAIAFASLLELLKEQEVQAVQDEPYGEIWIDAANAQ